jgi:hypothetical protein
MFGVIINVCYETDFVVRIIPALSSVDRTMGSLRFTAEFKMAQRNVGKGQKMLVDMWRCEICHVNGRKLSAVY